jgi:ecotin
MSRQPWLTCNRYSTQGKTMNALRWMATPLLLNCIAIAVQAEDELKAFPPAEPGMVRYVLRLPKQNDEDGLKVQLIVGKRVKTDAVNRYFFGGKIEEVNIEGWGYTRYVVSKLGPMAGTLMAVDPNQPQVERFISLGGGPYLIRYNSRLPVVLYLPDGAEARYRIWHADVKTNEMPKG